MAGVSSLRRLPKAVQAQINAWFDAGATVDEVTTHLKAMGAPVSRSAVGRRRQEWGKIIARVRESRELAEVMARSFRDAPANEMAQANIEMLHHLMMRIISAADQDDQVTLKPSDLMALTKAINQLTGARRAEVATTLEAEQASLETPATGGDTPNMFEVRFVQPTDPLEMKNGKATETSQTV